MSPLLDDLRVRVRRHLEVLYPELGDALDAFADELIATMGLDAGNVQAPTPHRNHWDERDVLVISYGNSIVREGEAPLATLRDFLGRELSDVISGVHILPFFPFSSDDGFSVIEYLAVNESLGDWEDVEAIARDLDLMSDLVINHMSARSRWFDNFKQRVDPGRDYFFEASPGDDLSAVVRPRTTPLLTEVETADGTHHVWCTFGPDQVDLDFRNPRVLAEFVNIIAHYLGHGVRIFRLDAVAFLWKEIGSACIHLPQTHEVIKLLRLLIEHRDPSAIVITETNVPNRENLTYFGNGNEAHVIYNFSLPPLVVHTLLSGDCRHLKTWMMSMPPPRMGTAYLNFLASHDGVGLRPAEGLLTSDELESLTSSMLRFGGQLSFRRGPDGFERPYEINISLFDAFKGTAARGEDGFQIDRFLCAHAIMLGLEGIPALYIHSLLATENDHQRYEHTRRKRSIHRHVWSADELESVLADPRSHHARVFAEMRRLLSIRRAQPAFHPNATQFTLHLGPKLFGFWRQSMQRDQSIFAISNVTDEARSLALSELNLIGTDEWVDLLSGEPMTDLHGTMELAPYRTVWLSNLRP